MHVQSRKDVDEHEVRLALAGAGSSGHDHLHAAAELEGVAIVAVADPDVELARRAAEQFGIDRVGTDVLAFLGEGIDGVIVAVPTDVHARVALPLLDRGMPVLLEKPLARSLDDARTIQRAAGAADVPLHSGLVRRFDLAWGLAMTEVRAGRIGRPTVWRHSEVKAGPIDKPWYNQAISGGGPFVDECVHTVDIALDIFGPVEWVFAHLRTLRAENTAYDTGTATLHFCAGDELMLSWSWGLPRHCRAPSLFDLFGSAGCIILGTDHSRLRLEVATQDGVRTTEVPTDTLDQAFVDQLAGFAQAIRQREGYVEDRCALEALRVCLALLESADSNKRVDLEPCTEAAL
jgi:phthalate 4,5-cis-dihydrodiol dehydrogenase